MTQFPTTAFLYSALSMTASALSKHLRCFAFLFANHTPSHFLIGFFLNELMGRPGFTFSLGSGMLVCGLSALLNLLTYFWRQRYNPDQLVRLHLYQLLQRTRKGDHQTLRQDLECLQQAPYLSPTQRERVAFLCSQLHTQPVSVRHLRFQLEQML